MSENLVIFIALPLSKTHAHDEAARPLGEGIAFGERVPKLRTVIGVQAMDEFVRDD